MRNNIGLAGTANIVALNRTQGGFYIKSLDLETQYLPGNFGVRVIEQMPTNLSDVWRERKNT